MRAILSALLVASVAVAAPVDARKAPPKHQAAKQGEAQRRALARQHAAQVRRRAAARRRALTLGKTIAPATPGAPEQPAGLPPVEAPADEEVTVPVVVAAPLARTVGISLREFTISLTRSTVGAGDLTVQVLNRGEDPHDLRIDSFGGALAWHFDELASLENSVPTVVPVTPGVYRVFCTLPGHEAAGMTAQLTVAAG